MSVVIRRHWLAFSVSLLIAAGLAAAVVSLVISSSHQVKAAGTVASGPATSPAVFHGRVLDPTHNAQIKSVVDAARSHQNPERLSPLFAPHKFDAAAFAKNPHAYLDIAEPGRVWDVSAAGPNVKPIAAKSSAYQEVQPLGMCNFTVTAAPNTPVTFTSFDGGCFQSELSTITLQADANGEATAVFTATEGTVGNVNMLAACPLCCEQLTLIAHIPLPNQ